MKVYEINPTIKGTPAGESVRKNRSAEGRNFSAVLKETIDQGSEIKKQAPSGSVTGPISVTPTYINTIGTERDMKIADRLEHFLNIMEKYHRKLGDPRFSLKDVHPLVNEMTVEKNNLQPLLESLPDQDPLKGVLNEAMITASLEVVKFNRGDYI